MVEKLEEHIENHQPTKSAPDDIIQYDLVLFTPLDLNPYQGGPHFSGEPV